MLDRTNTRIREAYARDVGPTGTVVEGMSLAYAVSTDGLAICVPSVGTPNETFAGIAYFENVAATTVTLVEDVRVPASPGPYTFTLKSAPLTVPTPQMSATRIDGSSQLTVVNTAPLTGEVRLVDKVLTFNSAQAGLVYRVVYRYSPTRLEAGLRFGQQPIGDSPVDIYRKLSVITEGDVGTDQFVISDNWFAPDARVFLGANGLVTKSNTGTYIGSVLRAPSPDSPFLVFHIAN